MAKVKDFNSAALDCKTGAHASAVPMGNARGRTIIFERELGNFLRGAILLFVGH